MPTETDDPFEDENGDADEATGQTTARGQLELFPKRAATGLATQPGDQITFAISLVSLRKAALVTTLARTVSNPRNASTVEILKRKIRISARRAPFTLHVLAPLQFASAGVSEGARSFDLPHAQLRGISPPHHRASLRSKVDISNEYWKVLWERARLTLTISPPTIDAAQSDLQDWRYIGQFDPLALNRALEIARIVSRKDRYRPYLAIIEVADGRLRAGREAGVIIVQDPALGQIGLRVAVNGAKALASVLTCLDPEKTHFYESNTHWMMSDTSIVFKIEKPDETLTFPIIEPMLDGHLLHCFKLHTNTLFDRLVKLYTVVRKRDESFLLIECDAEEKLHLRVQARAGTGDALVDLSPPQPQAQPTRWSIRVPFDLLLKLVSKVSTIKFLEFGILEGREHILAMRCDDKPFQAWAFLSAEAEN